MGDGFGTFIFAVIFVGIMFTVLGIFLYFAHSKKGQRAVLKVDMKREVKRSMCDAEIQDGLMDEIVDEVLKEKLRKQRD